MKKQVLSAALAMTLAVSMAVPAFAAEGPAAEIVVADAEQATEQTAEEAYAAADAIAWTQESYPGNGLGQYAWNEGPDAEKIAAYIKAADLGSQEAMWQMCDIFIYGKKDFKVDYDLTLKYGLAAIEGGSTNSGIYTIVGRCYEEDKEDYETALKYYMESYNLGDMKAGRYVALLYWNDRITEPEEGDATVYDTAIKYMILAAGSGDRTASSYVGQWYMSGKDITIPEGKTATEAAMEYFEAAVTGAHGSEPQTKEACIYLGRIYENDATLTNPAVYDASREADLAKALEYYKMMENWKESANYNIQEQIARVEEKIFGGKNGLVEFNGGKFIVTDGVVQTQVNGLWQNEKVFGGDDEWYYFADGQAQTQYTGLVQYDGQWFYVTEGRLDTALAAVVDYDGGKFLVAAGRILKEVSGLAQDPATGIWYYFAEGQVQTQYTGPAEYDGATFNVVNGMIK